MQHPLNLRGLESPTRCNEQRGWTFGNNAFQMNVGTEMSEELANQLDVISGSRKSEEVVGMKAIILGHRRTLENLELMELERLDRQRREEFGPLQHLLTSLAWEAEDEVDSDRDATFGQTEDGLLGTLGIVTTTDAAKDVILKTLDPHLYLEAGAMGKLLEQIEHGVREAVGTGGNDQPDHIGHRECLLITATEHLDGGIGAAI